MRRRDITLNSPALDLSKTNLARLIYFLRPSSENYTFTAWFVHGGFHLGCFTFLPFPVTWSSLIHWHLRASHDIFDQFIRCYAILPGLLSI